jgi:integrator complex subunit 2
MDVTPAAFKAIHTLDVDAIGQLSADELRPLLPCLVRMGVYSSCHNSPEWANKRKIILQIISQNEEVNSIISLLSVDFHAMEIDVKKELEQKSVLSANLSDNLNRNPLNDNNVIISSIVNNLSLDFERSDGFCRMRLIISELFAIQAYASELRS